MNDSSEPKVLFRDELLPLPSKAPKDFEETLGCLCVTRYLAFYLNENDHIVYDNGVMEDLIDLEIWEEWKLHGQLMNTLNLDQPEILEGPCPALVLDTVSRVLFRVSAEYAREHLYKCYVTSKGLPLV